MCALLGLPLSKRILIYYRKLWRQLEQFAEMDKQKLPTGAPLQKASVQLDSGSG